LNVKPEPVKYSTFPIRKRNGKNRVIAAPDDQILAWQRKFSEYLLEKYNTRSCVHVFAKGKSVNIFKKFY